MHRTSDDRRGFALGRSSAGLRATITLVALLLPAAPPAAVPRAPGPPDPRPEDRALRLARLLVAYFEEMSLPKPILPRQGDALEAHRRRVRERLLRAVGLDPLPERIPLDPRETPALDHPWCAVRRVYYRIWPGVYSHGLLFLPGELPERPAPAVLCPHGHWRRENADPIVQARCVFLAKLGYVVFSPKQQHYEDLNLGISHQTVAIWSNMRAIDYLESLPEVDGARIGVCGESGGGLQTQMLCALDPRVKAAAIVGLTCDFREILFPYASHCTCNHYPGPLRFTDAPELSALGLPLPVLYITMDDWTKGFCEDSFPAIRALYEANGAGDRVACAYEPTEHTYDRSKREMTYAWMERWIRGREHRPVEPDEVPALPPEALAGLTLDLPEADAFPALSALWRVRYRPAPPAFGDRETWVSYRDRVVGALSDLLGEEARLPRKDAAPERGGAEDVGDLLLERVDFPGEGGLLVPAIVLRSTLRKEARRGPWPAVVILDGRGKDARLEAEPLPEGELARLAREGAVVALVDPRFSGELSFAELSRCLRPGLGSFRPSSPLGVLGDPAARAAQLRTAWERNAIVWGRPLAAMAATDIRAALDGLETFRAQEAPGFRLVVRGSGELAIAALFAAALDPRVRSVDADLEGRSFAARSLPPVPFVLRHGDVLQWAALLADRELTLRNVPAEAGDVGWLREAFAAGGGTLRTP